MLSGSQFSDLRQAMCSVAGLDRNTVERLCRGLGQVQAVALPLMTNSQHIWVWINTYTYHF